MSNSFIETFLFPPKKVHLPHLYQKIKAKTILITGASFGIGECIARLLAMPEVHLILVARTHEKLISLQKELEIKGAKISVFSADLYLESDVNKLISFLTTEIKTIDIVVHNAGKSIRRSIWDSLDRYHDFTRTNHLNYLSPVKITLALLPILQEQKGHIINISAINILLPPAPYWSAYQASKSAFDQWFRCILAELHFKNIATTALYLPLVRTRMIEPTLSYKNVPAMQPEQVAQLIGKAIIKRNKKFIPWWAYFPQITGVLLRSFWEFLTIWYIRRKNHTL